MTQLRGTTRLGPLLAVAAFEARLARRFVRTWILGVVALGVGLITFAYYGAMHLLFSGYNASWAFMTSDLPVLQSTVFLGMLLGFVGIFFVFDWKHRDLSAHFAPTLHAAPLSPLELVWGKFLGLAAVAFAPMLVLLVFQIVVVLVPPVGLALPPSVFLVGHFFLSLSLLFGPIAVAFGMAGLFANQVLARTLAIVGGVAYLVVTFGAFFAVPERFAVALGAGVDMPIHSDFVGYSFGLVTWLQRATGLLIVAFFVSLAAFGPHGLPRSAGARGRTRLVVATLGLLLAASMAASLLVYERQSERLASLVEVERRAFEAAPELEVLRREIDVVVDPGRSLEGTARLSLRNAGDEPVPLRLRLNPGLEVDAIEGPFGAAQPEHDGSVVVAQGQLVPAGATVDVVVRWSGHIDVPSIDAASALTEAKLDAETRNNRRLQGTHPAFFSKGAVVLGLDAGWYPDPALRHGHLYPDRWAPSLAPGSVTVTVPEGWTAATVGASEDLGGGRFRFTTDEPVPGFALCAARYDVVEATIDVPGAAGARRSLRIRVLHHPDHRRNVELFGRAKEPLLAAVTERFDDVRSRTGLVYPHPELVVCEVPQLLAAQRATWDSPSRLGPPGMVLIREGAAFGARFEHALRRAKARFDREAGSPGGRDGSSGTGATGPSGDERDVKVSVEGQSIGGRGPRHGVDDLGQFDEAKATVDLLRRFNATDFLGGDVERAALRSFWDHRVRSVGPGQPVLAAALPAYVSELALGRATVDSPESIRGLNAMDVIVPATLRDDPGVIADAVVGAVADLDDVWTLMESTPLEDIDPEKSPRELVGILHVKGRRPLIALHDALGRERFAAALASLVASPRRTALRWDDVQAAFVGQADPATAPQVAALFETWRTGALPGFIVTRVAARRLEGAEERWQVTARVRNAGRARGTATFRAGQGDDLAAVPVPLEAGQQAEVGLVTARKPDRWELEPYLALNRTRPGQAVTADETPLAAEPFVGTREPSQVDREPIVVDDADEGFRVVTRDGEVAFAARDEDGDPVLDAWHGGSPPERWLRWRARGRWYVPHGAFDATAAIRSGVDEPAHPAIWRVSLPAGRWKVEAYLPPSAAQPGPRLAEQWRYVVVSADGEKEVILSLDGTAVGWNGLGTHRFGESAEVRLLDVGDGALVADAVRFVPEAP